MKLLNYSDLKIRHEQEVPPKSLSVLTIGLVAQKVSYYNVAYIINYNENHI